jgi:hypothetical protein
MERVMSWSEREAVMLGMRKLRSRRHLEGELPSLGGRGGCSTEAARWMTAVAQTATAADDWGRRRRMTGGDGGGRLGAPAAGMVVDDPGGGDEVGGGGDEVGGGEGFGAARDLERRCVSVCGE